MAKSGKGKPETKPGKTGEQAEEAPATVVGHIPAAATLFGPHPHEGEPEEASGSPEADLEREEAEERKDDPPAR